jgi:hypothetical protein
MADRTKPIGAQITDAALSAVKTFLKPADANGCLINAVTQNVRYTLDGSTAPTASVGLLMVAGQAPIYLEPGASLKVIEVAASASISLQWVFREDELMHHP